MHSAIKKIDIENTGVKYFIFCQYSEEENLSVYLFNVDNSELFTGIVSESDLRCMAAKVRLTFNDFYHDMLCALFNMNPGNVQFTYMLENCEGSSIFKWKKVVKLGVIITLGCIPVSTTDYSKGLSDFMVKMSIFIHSLNTKLEESIDELSKTEKEKSEIEALLEEAVKVKENIEEEMYTKFLMVLNTKKRKIKELYEKIEELESKKNKKTKLVNDEIPLKSTVSSSKYDESLNKPGPSKNCKQTFDSSLMLEDSDDEKPAAPVRRQRRRKKETDVKLSKRFSDSEETVTHDKVITKLNHSDEESVDGLLNML